MSGFRVTSLEGLSLEEIIHDGEASSRSRLHLSNFCSMHEWFCHVLFKEKKEKIGSCGYLWHEYQTRCLKSNIHFAVVAFKFTSVQMNITHFSWHVVQLLLSLHSWSLTFKFHSSLPKIKQLLTVRSNHAHDDWCCCGRTLYQYCSQNTNHEASDRVTEDFIWCKGFASCFSSQQSEGTAQKIQGADEKVQEHK